MNGLEIAREAREFQAEYAKKIAKPAVTKNRKKVVAGTVKIGGVIGGLSVTGLGKTWVETVADHDACVYGLEPGRSHRVTFQYAYLEG